jgi:hypothetical protein
MKLRAAGLALVVIALPGCSDEDHSSFTIGVPGANVSGMWIGSASDSTRQMTMTWQLTQQDRNVAGTFSATSPVGAPIYTRGSISGTLSEVALAFRITVPRGGVEDASDCTATFIGTADDVRQDSMAGTYSGSDTCGGTFAGGRFTLIRQ